MRIKEGFMTRKVAGEYVVVPVGDAGREFHGMIQLNDTGAFLWEQCCEETDKEQIVQAVTAKYEIDEMTARRDVERFFDKLENAEILEKYE